MFFRMRPEAALLYSIFDLRSAYAAFGLGASDVDGDLRGRSRLSLALATKSGWKPSTRSTMRSASAAARKIASYGGGVG
jgi:hypothetical protein